MSGEQRDYHHGDLRRTLIETGLDLARSDGMSALGLRELTRTVGVSANAAYRHFANRHDLVLAIALEAQQKLARHIAQAMAIEPADETRHPANWPSRGLRNFGLAYIGFACEERGWFELACYTQHAADGATPLCGDVEPVSAPPSTAPRSARRSARTPHHQPATSHRRRVGDLGCSRWLHRTRHHRTVATDPAPTTRSPGGAHAHHGHLRTPSARMTDVRIPDRPGAAHVRGSRRLTPTVGVHENPLRTLILLPACRGSHRVGRARFPEPPSPSRQTRSDPASIGP